MSVRQLPLEQCFLVFADGKFLHVLAQPGEAGYQAIRAAFLSLAVAVDLPTFQRCATTDANTPIRVVGDRRFMVMAPDGLEQARAHARDRARSGAILALTAPWAEELMDRSHAVCEGILAADLDLRP